MRASGARNIDALFLMLERDRYKFYKNRYEARYAKLVFLHLWDRESRSAF
jgi:hypothetical protein